MEEVGRTSVTHSPQGATLPLLAEGRLLGACSCARSLPHRMCGCMYVHLYPYAYTWQSVKQKLTHSVRGHEHEMLCYQVSSTQPPPLDPMAAEAGRGFAGVSAVAGGWAAVGDRICIWAVDLVARGGGNGHFRSSRVARTEGAPAVLAWLEVG